MRELSLQVNAGNWQKFMARRLSQSFQSIAKKIFNRDKHTCQYCGFQAQEYLDVLNHDQNYSNNKANNLVTACCFCSQCFFLESVGLDSVSGGQLIYMPELTQAEINSFCHVLFCAMSSNAKHQDDAQIIYRNLKFRSKLIDQKLGEGLSDPKRLGMLIIEHAALRKEFCADELLGNLRLLPIHSKFNMQLKAWASEALEELAG